MKQRITQIDNDFARLWYYPDQGIIHHQFLQPVSGLEFQATLIAGLDLIKKYGATKWLSDDRNNSILPADDSAWSQDYWLPRAVNAGWKYWAVLPPTRARGRINLERLMEFVGEQYNIVIEIFTNPDDAWVWLSQQGIEEKKLIS